MSLSGDWVCTLCRSDQEPEEAYDCESVDACVGIKAPYTLSSRDQRVSCSAQPVLWFLR